MPKIIKLDKKLSNQIAAGEVVERPVSIVKELIENSIDATSTKIKVEIFEGGIKEIIISDNGFGIEKEDLNLLGEKHSTSKIKNLEDLYNVLTFGFRGEAISSISSVSNVEIQTKYINENFGNSIKITFGERGKIKQISKDDGTKIIVSDLFQNTPARLNYLKTPKTEYNHILNYLYEIALAYPNIGFEFYSDSKQIFNFKEKEDLKTRIYNIYGEEFSSNLLTINFEMIGIKISGVISDPKISFPNRNRQNIFVNKRPIKSIMISKAIIDAYNRFIPHSMFPAYVLNLEVDPTSVDVNVHPRKLEVRFENEQNIFKVVYHSIEEKLNNVSLIQTPLNPPLSRGEIDQSSSLNPSLSKGETDQSPSSNPSLLNGKIDQSSSSNPSSSNGKVNQSSSLNPSTFPYQEGETKKYYTGTGTKFKDYSPYKNISSNPKQGQIKDAINFSKELLEGLSDDKGGLLQINENSSDLHRTKLGKIVGQSHNSYIIVETESSIKFFDQHALAERIIFEKLIKNNKKISSQRLLIGESLNITPIEANFLNDNIDIFKEIGFDFEILHGNIIIINSIPDFIKKENVKEVFLGILEDVGNSSMKKSKTLEEVKNRIIAYTACRSAIKFGNKLSLFEINKLLNDSIETYSSTCPHGRPVVFEISLEELKRKYER